MGNLHRLQWIDAQIRAGRYPNARTLAAAFEISRRQALRDFEYLRDSLGAPLVYSARHRGFTYSEPSFSLPGPYVTASQKDALGRLADYYAGLAGQAESEGSVYADLAELFRRLVPRYPLEPRRLPRGVAPLAAGAAFRPGGQARGAQR